MPDDILAEVYPCLPARCGNGDGIVDRKPGVLPGEYLQRETACRRIAAEQSPVNKQFYYSPPENLGELCGIFNRDVMEVSVIFEIHPQQLREGEYELSVWEVQEHVF
jgi:hypothetical protein